MKISVVTLFLNNSIKKVALLGMRLVGYAPIDIVAYNSMKSLGILGVVNRWLKSVTVDREFQEYIFANLASSTSQLQQDLFVAYHFNSSFAKNDPNGAKKSFFFVEFGATDGIELSNTYFLEKSLGWKGILCEPAKTWHEKLIKNRNCTIDFRCVFSETGSEVEFNETDNSVLSTIQSFANSDGHASERLQGQTYNVDTITLNDLLREHGAPPVIHYLSIDTEGSEFEILRNFDFSLWHIEIITIEHNFSSNRGKIHELLTRNGFVRVLEDISCWDDWYINSNRASS
jgi:FkbM family methyltransferase